MIRFAKNILPPTLFCLAILTLWQLAVSIFQIPSALLPGPKGIYENAVSQPWTVINATWITARQAICGFAMSLVIGGLVAILFSQSSMFRRCAFPYAIAFQTIPIISIAPLIIVWFDYGFRAIVFVSFLIGLFPIITNTTSGLINLSAGHVELFRLNGASRWQILTKLQIPSALPDFVNGAKISAGLSVLGAIIGEYFAGSIQDNRGIGYWIYDASTIRLEQLFVYVFASTILGVTIFAAVTIVGDTILLHWRDPNLNEQH
jgi:NitT/TauT family transport system permease protein